jgi:hypothetical protein
MLGYVLRPRNRRYAREEMVEAIADQVRRIGLDAHHCDGMF